MVRRRPWVVVGFFVALLAAAAASAVAAEGGAAPPADAAAGRDAAASRVCLVVVEDALGMPLAYASGFLLGEGRFVITDLASLAQPGAKQATLRFKDGSVAVGRQFGMADPATGLAAIQLEKPPAGISGLGLSTPSTSEPATEVTVVGWQRGQELETTPGRVSPGASAAELATRMKLAAPKGNVTFMNFEGQRPDASAGAAVVDKSGGVIGVLLHVAGETRPLVVPAAALRSALLASDRQLRPLAELPKPVWPVDVQILAGKHPTPADFATALRNIRSKSRCPKCNGSGTVQVRKVDHYVTFGNIKRAVYKDVPETCPTCKGEAVICSDGLYNFFAKMAENGAWLLLPDDTDAKVRDAAVKGTSEVVKALAKVGATYRGELAKQAKADLTGAGVTYPRGMVVYAQVRDTVDGPDGPYTLLAPYTMPGLFAVKSDRFATTSDEQAKAPRAGQWVVLAGLAAGPVSLGAQRPIYVRPICWTTGPNLGAGRPGLPIGPDPAVPPPPPPKPGEPDFFGIGAGN